MLSRIKKFFIKRKIKEVVDSITIEDCLKMPRYGTKEYYDLLNDME